MNLEVRDTYLVARQDIQDSTRSRRLIVWVLLYLCAAVAGTYIFSRILRSIETQITRAIAVEPTTETGQVVATIQQSDSFRKLVHDLVDDKDLAVQILSLHPLVIFYAWFTFTFMPLLVIIICSDTIARDIHNRYVRFHLFRTSRPAYAVGKSLSASLLLLLALTVSAMASLVTGSFVLHSVFRTAVLHQMFLFMIKCWIFNLSYLGIALMASQLRRSPLQAQLFALLTYFCLSILHPVGLARSGPGFARLWQLGVILSPTSQVFNLWHPSRITNMKAATWCLALGFLFFCIGFARFARRDL